MEIDRKQYILVSKACSCFPTPTPTFAPEPGFFRPETPPAGPTDDHFSFINVAYVAYMYDCRGLLGYAELETYAGDDAQ